MSEKQKGLGGRIRDARLNAKISQESLAELAEVHVSYIGQVERGEKNPSVKVLARIAQALKIPLSHFIEGVSESRSSYGYGCSMKTHHILKLIESLDAEAQNIILKLLRYFKKHISK